MSFDFTLLLQTADTEFWYKTSLKGFQFSLSEMVFLSRFWFDFEAIMPSDHASVSIHSTESLLTV